LLLSEFGFLIDLIHKKNLKKKKKKKKQKLPKTPGCHICMQRKIFSFLFDELKLLWNKLNPSTYKPSNKIIIIKIKNWMQTA
jgi:transcription elongation factor Elf1